jgi:hypothetical protein
MAYECEGLKDRGLGEGRIPSGRRAGRGPGLTRALPLRAPSWLLDPSSSDELQASPVNCPFNTVTARPCRTVRSPWTDNRNSPPRSEHWNARSSCFPNFFAQ